MVLWNKAGTKTFVTQDKVSTVLWYNWDTKKFVTHDIHEVFHVIMKLIRHKHCCYSQQNLI